MSDKPKKGEVIAKSQEQAPVRTPVSRLPWLSHLKRRSYQAETEAVKAETELGKALVDHERVGGDLMDIESILEADASQRKVDRIRAQDEIEIAELEGGVRKKELMLQSQRLDHELTRKERSKEQQKQKRKESDPVTSALDRLRASTKSFEDLKKMRSDLDRLVEDELIDDDTADTFYDNTKDDLMGRLYSGNK